MALTNLDITYLIEPFQRFGIFKGVFPCDSLPNKFSLPAAFVVNLSNHNSRGSHWIAIYIDQLKRADYFDSFGLPPTQKDILNFLQKHSKSMTYNKKQIQHIISNKCGKYVTLFVLCKLYGKNVNEVFERFSLNLAVNEIIIDNLLKYFTQLRKNIIYGST